MSKSRNGLALAIWLCASSAFGQGTIPPKIVPETVTIPSGITGTLPVGNGGTGVTSATDDAVLVGNGTALQSKVLTTCSAADSALTYDTSANAFGCNTITSAPGGAIGTIQFHDTGDVFGGFGSWDGTTFTPGTSVDVYNVANTTDFRRWRITLPDAADALALGAVTDNGVTFTSALSLGSSSSSGPFSWSLGKVNSVSLDGVTDSPVNIYVQGFASTADTDAAARLSLSAIGANNTGPAEVVFAVAGTSATVRLNADESFEIDSNGDFKTEFTGAWTGFMDGVTLTTPTFVIDSGTVTAVGFTSPAVAFSGLPACNGAVEGTTRAVTDSTTATWGATVTGTGSNHVLAYCNGTNWTVTAK